MPWQYELSHCAGTVHVCGSYAETASVERQVDRGIIPDCPYVLVGRQFLAGRRWSSREGEADTEDANTLCAFGIRSVRGCYRVGMQRPAAAAL